MNRKKILGKGFRLVSRSGFADKKFMQRTQSAFMVFILCLTLGLMGLFFVFQHHFSGVDDLKNEIASLKAQLRGQEMKTELAQYDLRDFAQTVAFLIPSKDDPQGHSYQVRNIASLVQTPAESLEVQGKRAQIMKAKKTFQRHDYEAALHQFKELYKQDVGGIYSVEIRYFLAESYYMTKRYGDSLKIIQELVQLFPEHDLTGYGLLRLGQIFNYQNREEEAIEVFQMIRQKFQVPELKAQADLMLKKVRKS